MPSAVRITSSCRISLAKSTSLSDHANTSPGCSSNEVSRYMCRLPEGAQAQAAMVAERTRLEASSVSQLHDQKLEGMAAVKKAQQAENQVQKEADEVRAALASAAGDETDLMSGVSSFRARSTLHWR